MAITGCAGGKKHNPSLEDFTWLLGTWALQTERGTVFEVWTRKSDTLFSGLSFRMVERDTVLLETIALTASANGIFLIPTVADQNQGRPVTFALASQTKTSAAFENMKHDFPSRIAYSRIADTLLLAEISGRADGKPQSVRFEMRRR